jgi:hypothetical protein
MHRNIKKIKFFIVFLFLISSFALPAQTKPNDYKEVDEAVRKYSNSTDNNTIRGIARFIFENFSKETDKLRAIFIWLSENFDYDVENMYSLKSYSDSQELIDGMLEEKKGVCMHFAYLFKEIGDILGITSHIISGYTKQDGVISSLSHVWCASFVDSEWLLIDPTWGAGHVQNNKYVKKLNDDYFKTEPDKLIQTHFPYDPLWQFLYYPVSAQEFNDGHTKINNEKLFFNYLDTLKTFENETRLEQLISMNKRIEQSGVTNAHTRNQLKNNETEIEFHKLNIAIDYYNSAVSYYNEGVNALNRFITYRNNQFNPQKSEMQIRIMVNDAEIALIRSQEELQKASTTDESTLGMIYQLEIALNEAITQADVQKEFINKYFNTKPILRKTLFNKYYWMGIPLN